VIAKRTTTTTRLQAVCDRCHGEGIAIPFRPGATRKQRRDLFLRISGGDWAPALDGKWLCPACEDKKGKIQHGATRP